MAKRLKRKRKETNMADTSLVNNRKMAGNDEAKNEMFDHVSANVNEKRTALKIFAYFVQDDINIVRKKIQ